MLNRTSLPQPALRGRAAAAVTTGRSRLPVVPVHATAEVQVGGAVSVCPTEQSACGTPTQLRPCPCAPQMQADGVTIRRRPPMGIDRQA